VHQALKNRQNLALHNQIALALIVVYVLFAASRDWLILTVLIFIVMFVFLVQTFQRILNQQAILTSFEKIFLLGQIAIYTGWSTVALFANTASAIKFYGVTDVGQTGTIWQSLILIAALALSTYWIRRFKANWAYVGTILGALAGILVNLWRFDDFLVLKIIAAVAILWVIIWAIIVRRS
jgi:hypothetical protein